jgi:RNA polymerase sigma-70 factor, ECF subfamily
VTKSKPTKPGSHRSVRAASDEASHTATRPASCEASHAVTRPASRLPLEFREVIILYELEGLSYKELASTLGIPVGTVMSRLSRARRRLRQEFAGFRHTESQDGL